MTLARAALVAVLALAACRPAESPSERCRVSNAINRGSRGFSGRQSATADALEDIRCDEMEREEQRTARTQAAQDEQARREREALDRQTDAQLAKIRALPSAPELGATIAEAKVICERERGSFLAREGTFGCRVGGPLVFAGLSDSQSRVSRVDAYYEGADLASSRDIVQAKLGPPERESISPEGFRVFEWARGTALLTMYPRGVRMTTLREP